MSSLRSAALVGGLLFLSSPMPSASAASSQPLQETRSGVSAEVIAQREAQFAELLTGCKLVGFFTQSNRPNSGQLEDSYTITRVSKQEGDLWRFEASIEFGGREIPIALNLPVLWAGDTPMISVTDMSFPMLGKYSARVMFYDNQYAGVWSGAGYGGQMWGRVVQEEAASGANSDGDAAPDPKPEPAGGGGDSDGGDSGSAESWDESVHWPSFRGPDASGVSDGPAVPTEWDVEEGTNILWHYPFPGLSHSSPVIWGDKLFLTTAVRKGEGEQELKVGLYGDIFPVKDDSEYTFELHCLDKNTGDELWSRVCWEGVPAVKRHPKGSHAACSPAVDGQRVLAFFGGEGLYAYDLEGNPLWEKDLGPMDSGFFMMPAAQWGFSSSPILYEDMAIVQCDQQKGSFLAALKADTGEELWRTAREEVPTWSTPTILETEDRLQVICNGFKRAAGYDLATGEELWHLGGGGDIPVPTPICVGDLIFMTNAHGKKAPIWAIDASAEGEIQWTEEFADGMAWSKDRRGNYMQTPLAYGDSVYFCSDAGIMSSFDVFTGDENYRQRLGDGRTGFTSSPVAANGNLYYASEEGDVHVVQVEGEFKLLSVNSLGEECMSTPAISEGVLYYRTRGNVLAIGFQE